MLFLPHFIDKKLKFRKDKGGWWQNTEAGNGAALCGP